MKLLHRMILRMLPGPFFAALGTLMLLLLLQFLMRYMKDLVGKGIPVEVIVQLIAYNLAYMLVLAVPMAVLLAIFTCYTRLSETGAYAVAKSAGVALPSLMWPTLIAGLFVTGGMAYFNNVMLPEANYRAKNLWSDIRQKKPGFQLQPGLFYTGLQGYSIRALEMPEGTDELRDVTIFDNSDGDRRKAVVVAKRGWMRSTPDGTRADLLLEDGEMHRMQKSATGTDQAERYERLKFEKHRMGFDLTDFAFVRSDLDQTTRSDRTMRTSEMMAWVDSLEASVRESETSFLARAKRLAPAPKEGETGPPLTDAGSIESIPDSVDAYVSGVFAGLDTLQNAEVVDLAIQQSRGLRAEAEGHANSQRWNLQRAKNYKVEIHKKNSIALACFIFMLIGIPIALLVRKGGITKVTAVSGGIFLFYWVTLVLGEKFSDNGSLDPWVAMWMANMVIGLAAAVLVYLAIAPRLFRFRLWRR